MLSKDWLAAFLPIGSLQGDDDWIPLGAGVIFHVAPMLWYVTASHVVRSAGAQPLSLLVPRAGEGGVAVLDLTEMLRAHRIDWIRDERNDLAASPFPASADLQVKAVGAENCLPMAEVAPSMQAFTVGCPYGVRGFDPDSALPLVMGGIVAGKAPRESLIYTDAPTFKGNSGGPLVVVKSPFDGHGHTVLGVPTVYLAGIVLELALIQGDGPDALPMPPLHLGIAKSTDAILALLQGEEASQLSRTLSQGR